MVLNSDVLYSVLYLVLYSDYTWYCIQILFGIVFGIYDQCDSSYICDSSIIYIYSTDKCDSSYKYIFSTDKCDSSYIYIYSTDKCDSSLKKKM